jgi:hypothetical protein
MKEIIDSKYPMLIYRGSRDGMNASAFHSKCDGVKETIFIARSY